MNKLIIIVLALLFFACGDNKTDKNSKIVRIRDFVIPVDKILNHNNNIQIFTRDIYDENNNRLSSEKHKSEARAYISKSDTVLVVDNYFKDESGRYIYTGQWSDTYYSDGTIMPISSDSQLILNEPRYPKIFVDFFSTKMIAYDPISQDTTETRLTFQLVQHSCFNIEEEMLRIKFEDLDGNFVFNRYLSRGHGSLCAEGFFINPAGDKIYIYEESPTFFEGDDGIDIILPSEGDEISINKKNITVISINESGNVLFDGLLVKEKYIDQNNLYQLTNLVENEIANNEKMIFSIQAKPETSYADYIKVLDYIKLGKATKIRIAN